MKKILLFIMATFALITWISSVWAFEVSFHNAIPSKQNFVYSDVQFYFSEPVNISTIWQTFDTAKWWTIEYLSLEQNAVLHAKYISPIIADNSWPPINRVDTIPIKWATAIFDWSAQDFTLMTWVLEPTLPQNAYSYTDYDERELWKLYNNLKFWFHTNISWNFVWTTYKTYFWWNFTITSIDWWNIIFDYRAPAIILEDKKTGRWCFSHLDWDSSKQCLLYRDYIDLSQIPFTFENWWELASNSQVFAFKIKWETEISTNLLNWKSIVKTEQTSQINQEVQVNWKTVIATLLILAPILLTMYFWTRIFNFIKKSLTKWT